MVVEEEEEEEEEEERRGEDSNFLRARYTIYDIGTLYVHMHDR